MRIGVRLFTVLLMLALSGCQGFRYLLPGHSAHMQTAAITLSVGESQVALKTPARMPVPGGYWLGMASEDPSIVWVEIKEGFGGTSRVTLHAVSEGTTTVHYINRFSVGGDARNTEERERLRNHSEKAFTVTVTAP